MTKRALVVGSPGSTGGWGELLQGVEHDVRAMQEMLGRRGFDVDVCLGPAATRDGILAAYDRLIARCAEGDVAVIYYSGHGFYSLPVLASGRPWHGIVPVDLGASTDDDFRGITAWELSIKLAQLTGKTRNVTVILDCCNSSQISRNPGRPRVLPHPLKVGFAAHDAALRAKYGAACDAVHPTGNPDAVRVVACGLTESAYEYVGSSGQYQGVFTEALLGVLAEAADEELSWAAIGDALRARVLRTFPYQRPDLEGPIRRRLFSLDEQNDISAAPFKYTRDVDTGSGFRIGAGRLVGVQVGDVYGAMPFGATAFRRKHAIAELVVEQVSVTYADLSLRTWENGHTTLPFNAVAFPLQRQATLRPVALDVPETARPAIERALAAMRTLRVAAPGEEPLAWLRVAGDDVTIEDPLGPLFPPVRLQSELQHAAKNLANLGAAQGLRELIGEQGVHRSEVEIAWGVVDRGEPRQMPEAGGSLGLRDRIYVRIRSQAQRQLYAHIFNIGVRGKITLLSNSAWSGIPLRYGEDFIFGARPDGKLTGLSLSWPRELPRSTFPRVDELIVIVSTRQASLEQLETTEQFATTRAIGTKLQDLLAQLQDGIFRDVSRVLEDPEDYLIKRFSFYLHPRDAVMADVPFEVDENPLRQAGARLPAARLTSGAAAEPAPPAPQRIEIRLGALVVEQNRALGKSDLRVDALICTRAEREAQCRVAWTQRFPRVGDGERLALDNALLFEGPACDFVDICLWISRDTERSPDLAQLLAQRAASPEFRDATGSLQIGAGTAALAPWVAAVGGSAILGRIAYDLLLGATGKTIGLYRTSFLAHEQFGAGRHPKAGLHRAQDFSFSLVIAAPAAASAA
ncbi:MAG TPA: caspase family protein [Kofleriaceae bacterium]|nr:caspase family protein [Kofleriaceae bacterium]